MSGAEVWGRRRVERSVTTVGKENIPEKTIIIHYNEQFFLPTALFALLYRKVLRNWKIFFLIEKMDSRIIYCRTSLGRGACKERKAIRSFARRWRFAFSTFRLNLLAFVSRPHTTGS
jgi:hypothetical protein